MIARLSSRHQARILLNQKTVSQRCYSRNGIIHRVNGRYCDPVSLRFHSTTPSSYVEIGGVRRSIDESKDKRPFLDPLRSYYLPPNQLTASLPHLQWILQKDALQQDVLLIGRPGSAGARRRLALAYAALVKRPAHVVSITSDITESDLKQRRELVIKDGALTLEYRAAAPVEAAVKGHLLILEGIEQAARNVLPTLNNLLEHRSMNLEDGRLLVPPDTILEDHDGLTQQRLVKVHPDFRVIATTAPTKSLDPPLRSRFQIRRIEEDDHLYWHPSAQSLASVLRQSNQDNDEANLQGLASIESRTLDAFPAQDVVPVLLRGYPVGSQDVSWSKFENSQTAFDSWLDLQIPDSLHRGVNYLIDSIVPVTGEEFPTADIKFISDDAEPVTLRVPCGKSLGSSRDNDSTGFCSFPALQQSLAAMTQAHAAGKDILILGAAGQGKSALVQYWGSGLLGYSQPRLVHAVSEMTLRDLFLRRITDPETGATEWESSTLLRAMEDGDLCVLDSVDQLRPDVLSALQSLCQDRDVRLPDGRRVIPSEGAASVEVNDSTEYIRVHPSFRLVLLASMKQSGGGCNVTPTWFTPDTMSMVSTIILPKPSPAGTRAILGSKTPCPPAVVDALLALQAALTSSVAEDCGVQPLSTRNLLRIARRVQNNDEASLHRAVCEVLVADLLPPTQRQALDTVMRKAGISNPAKKAINEKTANKAFDPIVISDTECTIGDFVMERSKPQRLEMVPSPRFFDIPSHIRTIKDLLVDWKHSGERAFLILGNQGVGKNMVIDRLCQVANFEREYIQLHRDSTIGQLTLQASLEDGKVVWNDSPLIKAASEGLSLVVDEADKAPTEVLAVLKGLVEDGELLLGDGRRISRHDEGPGIIPMHKNFTLWVLANRPGFPFHGNAFFKQIGDCFSTRVLANPDLESEMTLLESYGPKVDRDLLFKIATSFAELRTMADRGDISYPYSTREAVSVVKHLNAYPEDGILTTLHNVLDYDSFQSGTYRTLGEVFSRHGIPVESYEAWQQAMATKGNELEVKYVVDGEEGTSLSPPPLDSPKFGKWDDKNEEHVGGNQWAGGTGGSNTAGLGGRGGPFRLDRGHKVHQVSDEAKAAMTEEAKEAARKMAREALEKRLKEIEMKEDDWDMYKQFRDPIRKDVVTLKAILQQADLKQEEKGWIRRQSHGELDDGKLVDGVTGDKYIYKRRGKMDDDSPQMGPKRIRLVVDLSASMYRFNGYDNRLTRALQVTNMMMESFEGMDERFDYSIVGHSGDSPCIPLVAFGNPPKNEKQRLKILRTMIAHTQYCDSGDHTLPAIAQAIQDVDEGKEHEDPSLGSSSLVIAISDANLERYGIHPRELGRVMEIPDVAKSHAVFIASLGDEASGIKQALPAGRGHLCMNPSELPRIIRSILAAEV